jgi:O-antigen/teichoic acid export membrane protein
MVSTDDVLTSAEAGGNVIRGSAMRVGGNAAGVVVGLGTAMLLLRHLGVAESGRYLTVMSLLAIASSITDSGLNITGSRSLALQKPDDRSKLLASLVAQRLLITPVVLLPFVLFAVLAGYPQRMVVGTVLAGSGLFIVSVTNAVLLRLTVELRNAGLAFVDFLKYVVLFAGVALLVALGADLTPFFAVQIVVGLVAVVATVLLVGPDAFLRPRFDRSEQWSLLRDALPVAAAFVLGQAYFRMVIVLMSLISSAQQTGYFGGSLRAIESLVNIPVLVASVALPVLAMAARDDHVRLRYAIEGLSEGAVVAGVLVILVTARAAEPVMALIGGSHFRPSGGVLRIQVIALLFIALYQIWTVSLVALGRQRDLIFTNIVALLGVAVFAAVLVPLFGAQGGALASVLGDTLLASLIYWRLHAVIGEVRLRPGFLGKVVVAAALAGAVLMVPGLPDLVAAALAGVLFLGFGQTIGMLPDELRAALGWRGLLARRG